MMTVHRYALDNAAEQTADRFLALEACYDQATRDFLRQTGVGLGWRCLEVGGGAGTIGRWLADMTGADGRITVTDIAPERLDPALMTRANVNVSRHDIATDPLPAEHFDLIHARLVLLHLPGRDEILSRLTQALRPGGWLVLDEFDCGWTPVLMAPDTGAAELFRTVHDRFLELLTESGADVLWGRRTFRAFAEAGLTEISSSTFGTAWRGGSAGASLHRANTTQLRHGLRAKGVSEAELNRFWALLDDPAFVVHSYPLISVRGRRAQVLQPPIRRVSSAAVAATQSTT
jgi:ubiquinone/menaquinone biosynthesis C-methylase UbiE